MPALREPANPPAAASPPAITVEELPEELREELPEGTPQELPPQAVVHYHFPVEIEVRAAPDTTDPHEAARLALQWLTEGLHSL
jgi:5,10-methenyltetrahydromethanopterin hydrogenase